MNETDRRSTRRGLLISLLLHIALAAIAFFTPSPRLPVSSREDSVHVEVVSSSLLDIKSRPPPVSPVVPLPDAAASVERTNSPPEPVDRGDHRTASPPPDDGMARPDRFLSKQVLADPKSAGAAKALKQLAPSERIVQLCNLEAMAQVHSWNAAFQPDFLIAYAFAEPDIKARHMDAKDAVFRSKRQWHHIAFTCEVSADPTPEIASFAFKVGDLVPQDQWQDHNLTVDDGPAD